MTPLLVGLLVFLAALLYSSVGHGGASGYLAAMALVGLDAATMKPTALALNILVASIATVQFRRAGSFSWPLFWPFALVSAPCAFLGGMVPPAAFYEPVVGVVLLFAAYRMLQSASSTPGSLRKIPLGLALFLGAGIGLLSGLTGVGGGIFLSPLLLILRWAEPRQTAGVSAAFILVNSLAGLLGHLSNLTRLPQALPWWALAAVAGGTLGSTYGSRKLGGPSLRRLLAVVLVIAGAKLLLAP
jgi:uncharacterized membrane protein YfcA